MNASGRLNTCKSRGSTGSNPGLRPAEGCVTREQLARIWEITDGNGDEYPITQFVASQIVKRDSDTDRLA